MSSFRAALRIARRDAWRARWRSLLVVALIGLPVFVLATADVVWRTYQLSPAEKLTRELGAADAEVQWGGGGVVQQTPAAFLGNSGYLTDQQASTSPPPTPDEAELRRVLPAGTRILPRGSGGELTILTPAGVQYATLDGFDYADPIARGTVRQLSGRAPRAVDEIALTAALAHSTHLGVGDTLHTYGNTRTYRVVGIVQDQTNRRNVLGYVVPAAVPPSAEGGCCQSWLLATPGPVTWAQVRALNADGWVVLSRQAYLHHPPAAQVSFHPPADSSSVTTSRLATATLIIGMALLEVVLLAGPAFAVSARRQRRDLALIAAVGGRRRDLRNVVLANGVVLGLSAGVIWTVAGIAAAAVGIPWLGGHVDQVPGAFDVRPLELGGVALVSVVTAVLAAVFPARAAGRIDVIAALAGRRGEQRIRKPVPVIGAAVAGLGIAVALSATTAHASGNLILAGVGLTEIGLIICTPALIALIALLGRRLPLAPRLALRDASRNRSSAAPAVAAVMASMIGATGLIIGVHSQDDLSRRTYVAALPGNGAFVGVPTGSPATTGPVATTAGIAGALRANLPTTAVAVVYQPGDPCASVTDARTSCSSVQLSLSEDSPRFQGSDFNSIAVDDGTAVEAMFGMAEPAAVTALRHGVAVVTSASMIHNGKVALDVTTTTISDGPVAATDPASTGPSSSDPASTGPASTGAVDPPATHVQIPAIAVTDGFPAAELILPPAVATQLTHVAPQASGVLATLTHRPTAAERQAADAALLKLAPYIQVSYETGYHSPSAWMLWALVVAAGVIAVGAAAIATTLANVDGRADLVTLGAVGASPRTRRIMSTWRAGVIAGLGCVIGVAAGFVPAAAWIRRDRAAQGAFASASGSFRTDAPKVPVLHMVVPWAPVLLALVAVPVVAMLIAGTFTRSRLPSERPSE